MTIDLDTKSDNLIFMRELTATEVSRNFSDILDAVEAGEQITIVRGKKQIAILKPILDTKSRHKEIIRLFEAHAKNREPGDNWDVVLESINENDFDEDPLVDRYVDGESR